MQKREVLLLKNSSSFSGVKEEFDEQFGLQTAHRVHNNLNNNQKLGKSRRQVQSHIEFNTVSNAEGSIKYLEEGYQITAPSLVEINRVSGIEKSLEQKKKQQPECGGNGVDLLLHQTEDREQTRPKLNPNNSTLRRQKSSNYSTKNSHPPQELPLSSSSSLSPQQRFFFDPNAQAQAGRRLPKKNHKTISYFSSNNHNTKHDTPLIPSSQNTQQDTKKPSPLKKLISTAESNLFQSKILTEDGKSSPILENICQSPQQTSWACLPRSLNTTNTSLFAECNKQVTHKTSLLFPAKYPQQQYSSYSASTFSNSNPSYNNFMQSPQKFSPQNKSNQNTKPNENNINNNSNSNGCNSMYQSHPKSYLQSNLSISKEEGSTMCLSIGLKSDLASSNSSGRNFPLSIDSPAHLLASEPLKRKVSPSRFKESKQLTGISSTINSSNNNRSCGIPFRQSWSSSKKQQSQIYNNSTQILSKDHTISVSNSQTAQNNEINNSKSIAMASNTAVPTNNTNYNLQNAFNKNDQTQDYSAKNLTFNQQIPIQNAVSSSQQNNKQQPLAFPVGVYPASQPKQAHFELSKLFPLPGQQQQQLLQPLLPLSETSQQPQSQQQQMLVSQNQFQMKDSPIRQEQSHNLLLEPIDCASEIKRNTNNNCNPQSRHHPADGNNSAFSITSPQDCYQPKLQLQQAKQLVINLDYQPSPSVVQMSISKQQCQHPQLFSQQHPSQQHQQQQQTNLITITTSASKIPSHLNVISRESSKQSCKIIQEKSVNRVNITLKNSNSKKLSSSTSSITEGTLDIRTPKGATSSRDSIHKHSSSNPTSPKLPRYCANVTSDQQQDYQKQPGQQHLVLEGLNNNQASVKIDQKMNNNVNNNSSSLLEIRKSLLFAKNASTIQDKSNGNIGKDNESETAHVLLGNMIQVSQNKHIDLDDPIVQKEVSSIVRNLLKVKNDYKLPSSSNNNNSGKLKLKQQPQQIQVKQQQQQKQQVTLHSSSQAGLKRQNSAGNQGQHSKQAILSDKLYNEIVNKFDVRHYKTVSGSSTHFEAIPEIGGGSSSSFSFIESQQTPDSNNTSNTQQRQFNQDFDQKMYNNQSKD